MFDFLAKFRSYASSVYLQPGTAQPSVTSGITVKKAVSEALQKDAIVYRCIEIISNNASSVPFIAVNKDDEQVSSRVADLINAPNSKYSGYKIHNLLINWLMLNGNGYFLAVAAGRKRELWPINPDNVFPIPSDDITDNILGYEYRNGPLLKNFKPEELINFSLQDPSNEYQSISPLSACGAAVDGRAATNSRRLLQSQNGGISDSILNIDGLTLKQYEEWKIKVHEHMRTNRNTGFPNLVGGKVNVLRLAQNSKDMADIESMDDWRSQIATAMGVPLELLGDQSSSTYNNKSEALYQLWKLRISPLLALVSDTYTTFFRSELGELKIVPDLSGVHALSQDMADAELVKVKAETAKILSDAGANPAHISEASGIDAEFIAKPKQAARSAKFRADPVVATPPDNERESVVAVRNEYEQGIASALEAVGGDAAKYLAGQDILDEHTHTKIPLNLEEIESLSKRQLARAFELGLIDGGESVGYSPDNAKKYAVEDAEKQAAELAGRTTTILSLDDSTREMLRKDIARFISEGLTVSEAAKELENSYAFGQYRARLIATTEINTADHAGRHRAYIESGNVSGKISILDRDTTQHGDDDVLNADQGVIGLENKFQSGHQYPSYHPGCLCNVAPILKSLHAHKVVL